MKFYYTAKNFEGEVRSGEVVTKDARELASQLRGEGFLITSIKEIKEKKVKDRSNFWQIFEHVSLEEKMMFARNTSVMVSSGLPLSRAIKNLSLQTNNQGFQRILREIEIHLQSGGTLADGLEKFPKVFNELFVNMVRVGETGGNLEEVLEILALQLEKEHDLVKKVRGAMVYPAVVLVAMIGIAIIMMTYVVPQITAVFQDLNSSLPASTRFIIMVSNAFREHYILVSIGIVFGLILTKFLAISKTGKKVTAIFLINCPFIKNIVIKMNCARFARIYSSLLKSGVSVVESLKIIARTLPNVYYKRFFNQASESVQKGVNLSQIVYKEKNIFPILVPQMVEVGEETGKTEEVLSKMADFYEEEVSQLTKNLSAIIEPALMIVIGTAVGFFAISILQPMYSVLENIK